MCKSDSFSSLSLFFAVKDVFQATLLCLYHPRCNPFCLRLLYLPLSSSHCHASYVFLGAATTRRATCAGGQTVKNDACCVWFPILEDLQTNMFDGAECGDEVGSLPLRALFHQLMFYCPGSQCSSSRLPRRHWFLSYQGWGRR